MSNYISATLSPEDQQRALELFAELRKLFPFGIKLTTKDKRGMPMLDDGRRPFVEKSLAHGTSEPRIVPPYTDLKELSADLELYKSMATIENEALSLAEMISDTRMAAGSDDYVASLSIYQSAKGAVKMGVPGTQVIVDNLSKLFETQGKTAQSEAKVKV
jgi:hypothetical protein